MTTLKYSASLVFKSQSSNTDELAAAIPWTPELLNRIGQLRHAANGTPIEGKYYSYNYCSYVLNRAGDESASDCLIRHLTEIENCGHTIRTFRSNGGDAYVYVTWYTGQYRGEVFSVEAMRWLVALGIDLGVEVFHNIDLDETVISTKT